MKTRKIIAIITLISLFMCLFSCSFYGSPFDVPQVSRERTIKFLLEYHLYDLNLHYISCKPYYARIEDPPVEYFDDFYYDTMMAALMDDVPFEDFIAITHFVEAPAIFLMSENSKPYIYQRKDGPIPMKDYTVSSVSVIECCDNYDLRANAILACRFDGIQRQAREYFVEDLLQHPFYKILTGYTAEDNPTIVSSLQESYNNKINPDDVSVEAVFNLENMPLSYSLLFRFEETDNLVWLADIYRDSETGKKLYYRYSYCDVTTETYDNGKKYFNYEEKGVLSPIPDDVAVLLNELFV